MTTCWLCETDALGAREVDPRTGRWAHVRCCDTTIAGAAWRLHLKVRAVGDALFRR